MGGKNLLIPTAFQKFKRLTYKGPTEYRRVCLHPQLLALFHLQATNGPWSLSYIASSWYGCFCLLFLLLGPQERRSERSPKNPDQKIIKRVIALEGDIIRTMGHKNQYVKVPRGHMWVEGDHHGHSFDSNSFGPVSLGLLHAHATHILWPPERWQKLESILPPERSPVQSSEEE
ncbi:mitochondrial inner membrane protease subunit 2 isoform X3 [Castor canadensis]|uniref:Mitochondrial inner membrane protease subunit 2 isoform X3 n=1 Tax=Castor canadensis TaxID=51338 RepID=A0AC58LVF9_CASCN